MIRGRIKLREALERGEAIIRQLDTPPYRTWTGEVCHAWAVRQLIEEGALVPVRTDLCGDPMQWGLPE
jgi:hypothetical protein